MESSFLRLPGEIRTAIYLELLAASAPVVLQRDSTAGLRGAGSRSASPCDAPPQRRIWPAILRTRRSVCEEAASVLYGANRFTLHNNVYPSEHQLKVLAAFLDSVGAGNAGHIRHLCIPFPAIDLEGQHAGRMAITESSMRILGLVRRRCPGIQTLETSVESSDSMECIDLMVVDDLRAVADIVALFDARFRDIPSLKRIVVNLYDDPPEAMRRDIMLRQDWVFNLLPRPGFGEDQRDIDWEGYMEYQMRVDGGTRD